MLIGRVYPYGKPQTIPVTEDHPRQPHTFKGRMRKEQEDVVLAADAEGKIRGTILRLPDFYGRNVERSFLHSLFQAAARGGTANMLGPVDTPTSLSLFQMLVRWPSLWPKNPKPMDAPGILRARGPSLVSESRETIRCLLGLFSPLMRELVKMNYLLTTPVLMDDSALHHLLGVIRKTPYDEGLQLSLDAIRRSTNHPT
jgi:nucleoside-diphosphate-sugar epimerase